MKRIFAEIVIVVMLMAIILIIFIIRGLKEVPDVTARFGDSLDITLLYEPPVADTTTYGLHIDFDIYQPFYSITFCGDSGQVNMDFGDTLKIETDMPMTEAAKLFLDCMEDEYIYRITELKDSLRYWKEKYKEDSNE